MFRYPSRLILPTFEGTAQWVTNFRKYDAGDVKPIDSRVRRFDILASISLRKISLDADEKYLKMYFLIKIKSVR